MAPDSLPPATSRGFYGLVWAVVFYALVLLAIAGLAWLAYLGITGDVVMEKKWIGLCFVAIVLVLVASLPPKARFVPPGPPLVLAEQPGLSAIIETVARESGQSVPGAVHWGAEPTVDLTTEGGFLGLGGTRAMTIGFPLVAALDADALKALLAREFGRFTATDGKWSARGYRMRMAIRRATTSVDGASRPLALRILHAPFAGFAQFFLEITAPLARRQQALAEEVAARIAGADAVARARVEGPRCELMWPEYLESAVEPVLAAKRRPPLAAGWRSYLASPSVRAALARREERSRKRAGPVPSDGSAPVEPSASTAPLPVEIGNLDALELELLDRTAGPKSVRTHAPITWEQVVSELLEPTWRDVLTRYAAGIRGTTVENLPTRAEDLTELGRVLNPRDAKDAAGAQKRAASVLTAALAVALRRRGFTLDSRPGASLRAQRGEDAVDVEDTVRGVAAGRVTRAAWSDRCRALGIAGLDLGAEAQAFLA